MKKQGALNLLGELRAESEQKPASELGLMPLRIIAILVDYINDPQVKQAVDEIHY